MNDKLKLILEKIKLDEKYYNEFINSELEKVIIYKKTDEVKIVLKNESNFSVDLYKDLITCFETYFDKKVILEINPKTINLNIIDSYYKYVINEITKEKILSNIFIDRLIFKEENYFIKLDNLAEERQFEQIKEQVFNRLKLCGYDVEINTFIDEEESKKTQEAINNSLKIDVSSFTAPKPLEKKESTSSNYPKPKYEKKEVNDDTIKGRVIKDEVVTIKSIVGEEDSVTIDAEVFGQDEFEPASKEFKILTLKLTDYTDSIYAKIFLRDEDEFKDIKKRTKPGCWLRVRGATKNDKYSGNELVLNIRDINAIEVKKEKRKDDAQTKRVELHAHTKMSQMDGVMDEVEYIKQAISFGHRAAAITDHNGCQAFPHVFNEITSYNKGKEESEKFKGLYGTELTLIDDSVDIVIRGTKENLLESTYVVFDFETTGFNAGGGDSIIEIGAVKMQGGEILDVYDELIDPGHPISDRITEVTNITNEMLQGKDNEENAIKRFIEWFGDLPMVAHNAKFDISFLEMAYKKYNLGKFTNPVIDTLELSKTLDNTYARHNLTALTKRYDIPWDEDSHHRADYDAKGTALVLYKMLKKLDANFVNIEDLNNLVSKDEIHKYGRSYHVNMIAKNKTGLKNMFKLISLANTKYLYKTPRILRSEIESHREGLLIGSGCYESEVFGEARSKSEEELSNIISFYDYVEVQPPEVYDHLLQSEDFKSREELLENIKKVIDCTISSGKLIVATGDVHQLNDTDKIYREIIVNQKVPGGGRHPLAKKSITSIPSQYFRTTNEMLNAFNFLDEETKNLIVIENPNKIVDMVEEIEVIIDTGGVPFSPIIPDSQKTTTNLVYDKAKEWYGDPLPHNIEERIAKELYGDAVYNSIKEKLEKEGITPEDLENEIFKEVHRVILEGFDSVKNLIKENIISNSEEELDESTLNQQVKKALGGIIGGGFDVIYLIAQKLVKHSNDDGYLVGSRGSVGSSFVATMMGITEVNPLPAHYRCLKCQHSIFDYEDGTPLGKDYSSGFDLPDKACPKCGENLYKDGQDMPFATFLGFNADKVPDIDLNFSDLNQASAHAYTKVLFGEDNVYRAGTIGTVADKTAYGFAKGYFEDKGIDGVRSAEIERLAAGCVGVKRTTGQHPGGIVVIPGYMDVFDFTPFQFPADDDTAEWRTTHFDYHAIDQDVLKLDILGHSDPTQLRMIQDLTKTDILKVPLDDKDTMSIFTSTKALGVTNEQIMCETGTLGIPEFGTPFTISMVAETKPTTFSELIKISGLSHGTDVWLGNAQELIKNNIVPFKEVIGCRDDIMVYLMYKGVAPIKAFKIMEFVRKGKASKDPESWAGHKETMEKAGIEPWFIDSCQKIKYMFPKAHAAAYVISAFRIAWYKVHMPVYFYASWLTSKATDVDVETMIKGYDAIKAKIEEIKYKGYDATNKEMGQLESLKVCLEATARGIKFAPIELDKSSATVWGVKDETTIYPPFSSIDGLGDTVANNIATEREKGEFLSIEDLQKRCKVSQTLIEKMRSMGILDGMDESSQMTLNLF